MNKNYSFLLFLILSCLILLSCGSGGGSGDDSDSDINQRGITVQQVINRVSLDSSGNEANDSSTSPSINSNGRFIAFESTATDLMAGDTNNAGDIFIHDRDADKDGIYDEPGAVSTTRISIDSNGNQGTLSSSAPSISANGRYVAFESAAPNLVANDINSVMDVFVHDRDVDNDGIFDEPGAISTDRVSISSAGVQGTLPSSAPSISEDGRHVAFESSAQNLVVNDMNAVMDVFVHDRDVDNDGIFDEPGAVSTTRISIDSTGAEASGVSSSPSISPGGRYIAFESRASDLILNDTNGVQDIFRHDRDADTDGNFDEPGAITTTRISVDSGGSDANGSSSAPDISINGRFTAFESFATDMVAVTTGGIKNIFIHDRDTGITTLESSGLAGQSDNNSVSPSISMDGMYITFDSFATNLIASDTNGARDVFVRRRTTGVTRRVSVDSRGSEANNSSAKPVISADGKYIVFESDAGNLVANDINGVTDIFVLER